MNKTVELHAKLIVSRRCTVSHAVVAYIVIVSCTARFVVPATAHRTLQPVVIWWFTVSDLTNAARSVISGVGSCCLGLFGRPLYRFAWLQFLVTTFLWWVGVICTKVHKTPF